jgi:3-oxoacyl-[acyl-carrier-protein] synthase-1
MGSGEGGQGVCVVGFGARTAVGTWALASTAAVRAGISMFAQHPYMIDKNGQPMIVARDRFLSEEAAGADRFIELGGSAVAEALTELERVGAGSRPLRFQAFLGLPPERPGLPPNLAETFGKTLETTIQPQARSGSPRIYATGHSAGLMALEVACQSIATGSLDLGLVGGVESYLEPETLEWLDENDRLHSEAQTWGFIPGEAAGFVLLASGSLVQHLGLRVFGRILGVATAREKNTFDTDAVCLGEGLTEAFYRVLDVLPSAETRLHRMICDMNGEPYRGDEFGYTLVRTSDRFVDASYFLTPVDCWGDVGAASGPLFVILALAEGLRNYARGPYTLVWTSSDGGERSAAIVQIQDVPKE